LLKEGSRDVSFDALRRDPGRFEGKLFVLGGVIVKTRLTQTGSEIEGLAVPVDRYGYFKDSGRSEGRFIAVLPMEERLLDPEVFSSGRRVTFAGEFTGLRKAKIDEMEYVYPVFRIRDIHLWQRERVYYPYYYDPWFSPYPYYFRDPWWSYPSFYYYDRDHRDGSINRRAPPNQTPPRDTSAPLPSPERHERMPEKERPSR
jgi:outer membrane lipoprotein